MQAAWGAMLPCSLDHRGMCGPEAPTNLDWGLQGSGKHVEAQAGPPQAKAGIDRAKPQRVGCVWLDSLEGLVLTPDWGGAGAS